MTIERTASNLTAVARCERPGCNQSTDLQLSKLPAFWSFVSVSQAGHTVTYCPACTADLRAWMKRKKKATK